MTTQQDGKLIKHTTRSNICLGSKVHAVLSDDSDIICKAIKKKKSNCRHLNVAIYLSNSGFSKYYVRVRQKFSR